jgi:general stress protein 26
MSASDEQKIVSIMRGNYLYANLATCDGDQPRVRIVSPVVEDDMSIWVTTRSTSRKIRQLRENPKICLAFVEPPEGDKSVTVIGEAQIIADSDKRRRVWKLAPFDLYEHFPGGPDSDDFCLLKIMANRIEWREVGTGALKIYEPTRE